MGKLETIQKGITMSGEGRPFPLCREADEPLPDRYVANDRGFNEGKYEKKTYKNGKESLIARTWDGWTNDEFDARNMGTRVGRTIKMGVGPHQVIYLTSHARASCVAMSLLP